MATEPQNQPPDSSNGGAEISRKNIDHQIEELRAETGSLKFAHERATAEKQLQALQEIRPTAHALSQLEERASSLQARDPGLVVRIDVLTQSFDTQPAAAVHDPVFKTDLAHALQDAEKITGRIPLDDALRRELAPLAATSPGLKNQYVKDLLELTPRIDNPELVARIREKAHEIAGKANQNSKTIQEDITVLAIEVLKSSRLDRPNSPDVQTPAEARPNAPADTKPLNEPDHESRSNGPAATTVPPQSEQAPERPGAVSSSRQTEAPSTNPSERPSPGAAQQPAANDDPRLSESAARPATKPTADPFEQLKAFEREAANPATENPRTATSSSAAATAAPQSEQAPERAGAASPSPQTETPSTGASERANTGAAQQPPANDDPRLSQSAARPATPLSASLPKAPPLPPDPETKSASEQKETAQAQQPTSVALSQPTIKISGGALGQLLSAITPRPAQQQQQPAVAQQQPQPAVAQEQPSNEQSAFKQRLATYEQTRADPRRADNALLAADRAARAALDALSELRHTTAAAVLNRIEDAGANAKGGLKEVLSELKPGGKFEDLRQQFDRALSKDETLAAAHARAETALEQYGNARVAASEKLGASPNATRWAEHLQTLDAEIAKAGSAVPGKDPGSQILDKLGEKARELAEAVIEKVQRLFQRPDSSPSPTPQV